MKAGSARTRAGLAGSGAYGDGCCGHRGFSLDRSVYLEAGDTAGLERLAQYMVSCPFSVSRVVRLTDEGNLLFKSEKAGPRRFPEPGREDLAAGASRNFQVFEPLDFIAELTQHIPDKGEHLVRWEALPKAPGWLRPAAAADGGVSLHHRSQPASPASASLPAAASRRARADAWSFGQSLRLVLQ